MVSDLAFVGYLAPLSLTVVALLALLNLVRSVSLTFQLGRAIMVGAFLMSLLLGAIVFSSGPLISPILGIGAVGISLRLDALSIMMFVLVTFLATLLIQFSHNYLHGDPRQKVFFSRLYMTISAVLLLVLSGTLWQLVLAWIGASLALHELLVFYPERPRALRAARKKYIIARIGDLCLLVACVLIAQAFGTADLGQIRAAASNALATGNTSGSITVAALLIVVAACLKSAMFPFHGWLLEVMETPTPVSALLHAGLLNAGIFLVVRFGELVFVATPALILLIAVGGFTAIFASSAMITQNSVKVSLAYSSLAHMGFMLMLCGFGAHTVAIMHLIAHSCYKAHAFLSSGSIIDYVQNTGEQKLTTVPHPLTMLLSLATSLVMFLVVATALGIDVAKRPGESAMISLFIIAVAYLLVKGNTGKQAIYVLGRTTLMAMLVTLAFFTLELAGAALLGSAVAVFPTPDTPTLIAIILTVIVFASVAALSAVLPVLAQRPTWRVLYVHLKHGCYANALLDRWLQSSRVVR